MSLKFNKHPGSGYIKVICDICGGLFYRKDTTLVRDKNNFQNGLIVCNNDIDKVNGQILPNNHVDSVVPSPQLIRIEKPEQIVTNVSDDRVPSAPQRLSASPDTVQDYVALYWEGPIDPGSSGIIGYSIRRAEPQYGNHEVVTSNSGTESPYYLDITSSVSSEYTYEIAAINSFGTGAYTAPFPYPTQTITSSIVYLAVGPSGNALATGDGTLIILSP